MTTMTRVLIVLLCASLPLCATAETWPVRPIHVITGYAPGASVDIVCRIALNQLSKVVGQPVVVENRPGNASIVGASAAARATPDGYNYFCTAASAIVTNTFTFKSLPYDPRKDFVPVGLIGTNPFLILVNPKVPVNSLAELIALDHAKPGSLSFASDGTKNFSGLIGAFLNKRAKTEIVQVAYSSMSLGLQDAISGRVQVIMQPPATVRQFIKAGQLKPIAITTLEPSKEFDSVQPVAKVFPGFQFVGWICLVAPAHTPADIVQKMNEALATVLKDQQTVKRLADAGETATPLTPEKTAEFFQAEHDRWAQVMSEIQLQPN